MPTLTHAVFTGCDKQVSGPERTNSNSSNGDLKRNLFVADREEWERERGEKKNIK